MKYNEKVLKPFQGFDENGIMKNFQRGDLYRVVSITQGEAEFLNSRKTDFGFEYELIVKSKVNEEGETIQETVEAEKPKRGFPKKKQ